MLPLPTAPEVELFFKGEQPYGRRGSEEWAIKGVTRGQMVFSPDHKRFAYVRSKENLAMASAAPTPRASAAKAAFPRVVIRNLAGDPINEFVVYRPAAPERISWLDDRRLGYLIPGTPGDKNVNSTTFVVHDANTGEVLTARSGTHFIWGPENRHVAFLSGSGDRQAVVVDGRNVWPRSGVTRIFGEPVWSPDGHGLAFVAGASASAKLVVLVEYAEPEGDLTWPIPVDAVRSGQKLFWAGDSRVVIGESALKPKFAAGWERLQ